MKGYIPDSTDSKTGGAWIVVKKTNLEKFFSFMGGLLVGMGALAIGFYFVSKIANVGLVGLLYVIAGVLLAYFLGYKGKFKTK